VTGFMQLKGQTSSCGEGWWALEAMFQDLFGALLGSCGQPSAVLDTICPFSKRVLVIGIAREGEMV
jgi:hypothetical protein